MDCKYITSLSHISRHIVNLTFTEFQSLRSLGISFWLECYRIRSFIVCYWITRLWKIKTISDYKNSVPQWLTEKQLRHSSIRINKSSQHKPHSIGMLTHFRVPCIANAKYSLSSWAVDTVFTSTDHNGHCRRIFLPTCAFFVLTSSGTTTCLAKFFRYDIQCFFRVKLSFS